MDVEHAIAEQLRAAQILVDKGQLPAQALPRLECQKRAHDCTPGWKANNRKQTVRSSARGFCLVPGGTGRSTVQDEVPSGSSRRHVKADQGVSNGTLYGT